MAGYIGTTPVPQATQHRESFTATGGQTSFATAGYTPQFIDVYLNGVKLAPADFTATNGSDVVLASGATASDILEIVAYTPFEVANQTFTGDTSITNLAVTGTFTSRGIDDNADAVAITIDSSENVGIGTSSPAKKLDVDTTMRVNNAAGTSAAELDISSGSTWRLRSNPTSGTNSYGLDFIKGSAGTDVKMSITSAGLVGIGTSSPARTLHLNGSDSDTVQLHITNATTGSTSNDGFSIALGSDESGILNMREANPIRFFTSDTERMRIDSSGNLIVGDTSAGGVTSGGKFYATPSSGIYAAANADNAGYFNRNGGDGSIVEFRAGNAPVGSIGTRGGHSYIGSGDTALKFLASADAVVAATTVDGSGRANAIDLGQNGNAFKDLYLSGGVIQTDGGKSIFGGTSTVDTLVAVSVQGASNADAMEIKVRTNGKNAIEFRNSTNGTVGKITANASSTTYATTSDYRLKTDIQAVTNATNRLKQLNPVNFEWVSDGTRVDGFLAHEVQSIVPEAITGTKDAMRDEQYEVTPAVLDDDGNVVTEAVMGTRSVPDYQGIDQSKLVPLLVATIKELEARITALENA